MAMRNAAVDMAVKCNSTRESKLNLHIEKFYGTSLKTPLNSGDRFYGQID
jgi:hypothetical protein